MKWEDILKNQKTFQGLALGELSEDSMLEEDDDCVRRLRKIYDNLTKFKENLSGFYSSRTDAIGTTYFKDSQGRRIIAMKLRWESNPSNALACEVLEKFDKVEVGGEYNSMIYYVRKEFPQEFLHKRGSYIRYQTNITIRPSHLSMLHINMIVSIYPIDDEEYNSSTGIYDEYRRAFDV